MILSSLFLALSVSTGKFCKSLISQVFIIRLPLVWITQNAHTSLRIIINRSVSTFTAL